MKLTIGLIIVFGLSSCSFYAEIPEDEIGINKDDLVKLKTIQKDISKNFEVIADSNGYFSDRFYFDTDRFKRKLKNIDLNNYDNLNALNKKGTIKSLRIISENCTAYLLQFADADPTFYKYWDEVWLVYHNKDNRKCGQVDNSQEKTVWTKKLDDQWTLIKNKRRRYIGG